MDVQNDPLLGQQETCDAAAVLFGLRFAQNIHYKIKSSQASKARLSGGPFCSYRKFIGRVVLGRFGRFPTKIVNRCQASLISVAAAEIISSAPTTSKLSTDICNTGDS